MDSYSETYQPSKSNLTIDKIIIGADEDSSQHMAYRIAIHTNQGTIFITGCHDSGPNIEGNTLIEDN